MGGDAAAADEGGQPPAYDLEADYVIIGAGSAGCVLANRLSASGEYTVALIESGGGAALHGPVTTNTSPCHHVLFSKACLSPVECVEGAPRHALMWPPRPQSSY